MSGEMAIRDKCQALAGSDRAEPPLKLLEDLRVRNTTCLDKIKSVVRSIFSMCRDAIMELFTFRAFKIVWVAKRESLDYLQEYQEKFSALYAKMQQELSSPLATASEARLLDAEMTTLFDECKRVGVQLTASISHRTDVGAVSSSPEVLSELKRLKGIKSQMTAYLAQKESEIYAP